jgi:hypothetical protein
MSGRAMHALYFDIHYLHRKRKVDHRREREREREIEREIMCV